MKPVWGITRPGPHKAASSTRLIPKNAAAARELHLHLRQKSQEAEAAQQAAAAAEASAAAAAEAAAAAAAEADAAAEREALEEFKLAAAAAEAAAAARLVGPRRAGASAGLLSLPPDLLLHIMRLGGGAALYSPLLAVTNKQLHAKLRAALGICMLPIMKEGQLQPLSRLLPTVTRPACLAEPGMVGHKPASECRMLFELLEDDNGLQDLRSLAALGHAASVSACNE